MVRPSRIVAVMHRVQQTRSVPNKNLELLRNESNFKLDSDSDFEEKRATTPEEQSVPETRWCRQTIEAYIWHWCPRPPEKPLSKAEHRRIDTQVSIVELQGRDMGVSDEETLRRLNYVLEYLTTESRFAVQAIPFCIGKAKNKTSKEDYFLFLDTWRDLEQKRSTRGWQPASTLKQEEEALITQIEHNACMHAALKFLKAEGMSAEGHAYEELVQLGARLRQAQREEWENNEIHVLPQQAQQAQQATEQHAESPIATCEDHDVMQGMQGMQGMQANEANQLIEDIKNQLPLAILDVHRLENGSYVVLHAYSASEVIQYWRSDDWPRVFEARKEQTRQRVASIRQRLAQTSQRVEERRRQEERHVKRGGQTPCTYRSVYAAASAPVRASK